MSSFFLSSPKSLAGKFYSFKAQPILMDPRRQRDAIHYIQHTKYIHYIQHTNTNYKDLTMNQKCKSHQYDPRQIKQEINKFIHLLQGEQRDSSVLKQCDNSMSKQLSVIMSTSEPQSSSLGKQNSNGSSNGSYNSFQHATANKLFHSIFSSKLTPDQAQLLHELKAYTEDLHKQLDERNMSLAGLKYELEAEKKVGDGVLAVLIKLEAEDKELWMQHDALRTKYEDLRADHQLLQSQVEELRKVVSALETDTDFMKKLIFHANQNYQILERKCCELEKVKNNNNMNKSIQKQSQDNLQKSAVTKKYSQRSHSPSYSQMQLSPRKYSPRKQQFEDIYRKMILRTLKSKGKKQIAY